MKTKMLFILATLSLGLLIVSCRSDPTPTPEPKPVATATNKGRTGINHAISAAEGIRKYQVLASVSISPQ